MINIFKKQTKKEPKKQVLQINIKCNNGILFSWNCPYHKNHSFCWHYFDFYKWYFNRKQSDEYMFKSKQNETLIKRDDILTFEFFVTAVE